MGNRCKGRSNINTTRQIDGWQSSEGELLHSFCVQEVIDTGGM